MGQLIIAANYGIGVTSDEVTATRNDVIKGKTALTSDSDDEIIDGTLELTGTAADGDVVKGKTYYSTNPHDKKNGGLKDNSGTVLSATPTLDTANGRVQLTVPATAKYNTLSKLYSTYAALRSVIGLTASKLANGQSLLGLTGTYKGLGNAVHSDVLQGVRYSSEYTSNGTGSIPLQKADAGGGVATATNSVFSHQYAKLGVRNRSYLDGVNAFRHYIPNLTAANIKKNVNIAGLVGTHSGYVVEPTDLYNRGANPGNVHTSGAAPGFSFETGGILVKGSSAVRYLRFKRDFTGYTKLSILLYVKGYGKHDYFVSRLRDATNQAIIVQQEIRGEGNYEFHIPINNIQRSSTWDWETMWLDEESMIYRIWLS